MQLKYFLLIAIFLLSFIILFEWYTTNKEFDIADVRVYSGANLGAYAFDISVIKKTSSYVFYDVYVNSKKAKVFYNRVPGSSFNQSVFLSVTSVVCPLNIRICDSEVTYCREKLLQC